MQSCGLKTMDAFDIISMVIYPELQQPVVRSTNSD